MAYQDKRTKAEDFKSSAYTLIIVGVLGIAALVLLELGVFPIRLASPQKYVTYGVMGALFVIFIVTGLASFRSAKQYARQAAGEERSTDLIKAWARENIIPEAVNEKLSFEENTPDEVKCLKYFEIIKDMVEQEFGVLEASYSEELCEELYADIFENGGQE
ncbi:MAG: hypothetical protein LUE96_00180 [Lachnospiraceae bacterium]|nr:hypothetical protein [Lachnospiraceae bacterium]